MKTMIKYTFLFLFLMLCASCNSDNDEGNNEAQNQGHQNAAFTEISYKKSNEIFANPERGFMHTWTVFSEGEPVDMARLSNLKNEKVTLILRLYYLEKFKETSLSDTQLELIKTDFKRFREAGIKCVLRFAYTNTQEGTDASMDMIEAHLEQLKPIVQENADIIAFVQAGFIGAWGEWYYSSNGLTTVESRIRVVNKLLEVFPENVEIQLRTPIYKQQVFKYSTAINAEIGYSNEAIARVGFHNDCFLASVDDYGTYQNIESEKSYISKEAAFVPTGGETCPPSGIPTANCDTAEKEMELLKWTYLNLDYYGPVLQEWRNNRCFTNFEKRLGYRIYLQSSKFFKEAAVNSEYAINLVFNNEGFAPIYHQKDVFLIFRSKGDGKEYKKKLTLDIRRILPAMKYDWDELVSLSGIPAGTYDLLLEIEDASEKLKEKTEYNIRLANDAWQSEKGLNKLMQQVVIK